MKANTETLTAKTNTETLIAKTKSSVKITIGRCILFSQLLFGFHGKRNFSSLKTTLIIYNA